MDQSILLPEHGDFTSARPPGTLEHSTSGPLIAVHVQVLHRLANLYPHIQAPVTNSQSLGFRGNLAAPV